MKMTASALLKDCSKPSQFWRLGHDISLVCLRLETWSLWKKMRLFHVISSFSPHLEMMGHVLLPQPAWMERAATKLVHFIPFNQFLLRYASGVISDFYSFIEMIFFLLLCSLSNIDVLCSSGHQSLQHREGRGLCPCHNRMWTATAWPLQVSTARTRTAHTQRI